MLMMGYIEHSPLLACFTIQYGRPFAHAIIIAKVSHIYITQKEYVAYELQLVLRR